MDKKWKKLGLGLVCFAVLGGGAITIANLKPSTSTETQPTTKKEKQVIPSSDQKDKSVIERTKPKKGNKDTISSVSDAQETPAVVAPVTGNRWTTIDRSPITQTLAAIDKEIAQKNKEAQAQAKVNETPATPTVPVIPPTPAPTPKPQPEPTPEPLPQVDYRILAALVSVTDTLEEGTYTPRSYQALLIERAIAARMLQEGTATQFQVDNEVVRLQAALNQLVQKADKQALTEWVVYGQSIDRPQYTSNSIWWLDQALQSAQAVLADENIDQESVDAQLIRLQYAINSLVKRGDKTPLRALVAQANAVERDLYTTESVAVFDHALTAANEVLADEDATEPMITQAHQQLQAGLDQLKKKEDPDYTIALITRLLKECDALDPTAYTEDSFTALQAEMDKARIIVDQADVTTQAAKEQLATLQHAKDSLVKRGDKEPLISLLVEVAALDENTYTADSWAQLVQAQEGSQALVDNPNATQEQLDQKIHQIQTAIDQLQLKE